MSDEVARLQRKIDRLKKSQSEAEQLLEDKSRELFDLNQSLEKIVEERTLELKKSRDEAITATKSKDRFLARMSHEIRTPLNGIIGILDLLSRTELTEEQANFVKISSDSGSILLSIINDILEYSKIAAGKTQIELQEFDLEESIASVAEILSYKVHEKDLDFIIDISDDCPSRFKSDEQKIRQILINLIGNSIKFTPSGEIKVQVRPNNQGIEVAVIDTGIGIPEDKQQNIFNSFTQADAGDTRKYGGSGLGLSICKHFVSILGGEIEVESKEGLGTQFTFSIKNHLENKVVRNKFHPAVATVGVVLDNKSLQKMLVRRLKGWGLEVVEGASIEEIEKQAQFKDLKKAYLFLDPSIVREQSHSLEVEKIFVVARPGESEDLTYKGAPIQSIYHPLTNRKISNALENSDQITEFEKAKLEKNYQVEEEILLVEDNLINQKVALHMLNAIGLNCDVANNGEEAVDRAAEKFYKIILMDYNMPVMDGVTATRNIRALQEESEKKSHIIAMTASAMKETRESCVEAGMDDFITKPIRLESLSTRLNKVLARYKKAAN